MTSPENQLFLPSIEDFEKLSMIQRIEEVRRNFLTENFLAFALEVAVEFGIEDRQEFEKEWSDHFYDYFWGSAVLNELNFLKQCDLLFISYLGFVIWGAMEEGFEVSASARYLYQVSELLCRLK